MGKGIPLFQDSPEAGGHQLGEDDGIVVHCGSNELEEVWVPGVSSHVHLPREEADIVSRDDLVMEALCSYPLTSKYGHFDDCPPPSSKLLLCQMNLLSLHNPVWLTLRHLAE